MAALCPPVESRVVRLIDAWRLRLHVLHAREPSGPGAIAVFR